jgi:hypothetical protein
MTDPAQEYEVLVALFGAIPVNLVTKIAYAVSDRYPDSFVYDSEHPESKRLDATMCMAIPKRKL